MTVLAELVACNRDNCGYITYVFKNLEEDVAALTRYILCVRYPNWNHSSIKMNEVGYLTIVEIRAGVDKWFDGNQMVPYKYNTIQFLKFISKPLEADKEFIM